MVNFSLKLTGLAAIYSVANGAAVGDDTFNDDHT